MGGTEMKHTDIFVGLVSIMGLSYLAQEQYTFQRVDQIAYVIYFITAYFIAKAIIRG